jgi:uncharacterized protein
VALILSRILATSYTLTYIFTLFKFNFRSFPSGISQKKCEEVPDPGVKITDDSVIKPPISLQLDINRKEDEILLAGKVNAIIEIPCSRCLETFPQALETPLTLILRFSNTSEPQDMDEDDVMFLNPKQPIFDLDPRVIELLALEVPIKPLCREECRGICPQCGKNINFEKCICTQKVMNNFIV